MAQGDAVISSLQSALGCLGKCDCCDGLQQQINSLNQRINALDGKFIPKAERPQIVDESVRTAYRITILDANEYTDTQIGIFSLFITALIYNLRLQVEGLRYLVDAAVAVAKEALSLANLISQKIQEILSIPGRLSALESKVSSLENLINNIRNTAETALRTANSALNLSQRALEVAVDARALANKALADIQFLTDRTLAALQRLESLIRSEIASVRAEISRVSARVEEIVNRVGEIISRIVRLEGLVGNIQAAISGILSRLGILEQVSQQLYALVFQALDRIDNLERYWVPVLNARIEQAQVTANRAITKVAAIEGAITEVRARISALEQAIANIRTNITNTVNNITNTINNVVTNQITNITNNVINPALNIPDLLGRLLPGIQNIVNNNITNITNNMNVDLSPIVSRLTVIDSKITALPVAFAGNSTYTNRMTAVAAAGTCQTAQPGGCIDTAIGRGNNNLFNRISELFNTGANAAQLALLNVINTKLGAQIIDAAGNAVGIGGRLVGLCSNLALDRLLNILTFAATVHNATMLSQNILSTLTQAIQNMIDFVGITDANGQSYNIQSLIGRTVSDAIKTVVGVQNYEATIKAWNTFNRIYQAAGNLFSSLMSMGDAITQGLQVIGGQTGKIGNALRAWGAVSEKAYGWFNPNPNFSNPLLIKLNNVDETASMVENVTQQPLTIKSAKAELEESSQALAASLAQEEGKPQGREFPEAKVVKAEAEETKTKSAGKELTAPDLEPDED